MPPNHAGYFHFVQVVALDLRHWRLRVRTWVFSGVFSVVFSFSSDCQSLLGYFQCSPFHTSTNWFVIIAFTIPAVAILSEPAVTLCSCSASHVVAFIVSNVLWQNGKMETRNLC